MSEDFELKIALINKELVDDLPNIFKLFNKLQTTIGFSRFKLDEQPYEKNKNLKAFRVMFAEIANCEGLRFNQDFIKYLQEKSKPNPEYVNSYFCTLVNIIGSIVLFTRLTERFSYHPKNLEYLSTSFKSLLTIVTESNFLACEESQHIARYTPNHPLYVVSIDDPEEELVLIVNNCHEDVSFSGSYLDPEKRLSAEVIKNNNPFVFH